MSLRRFASLAGALLVAAIAALASYTHMRTVALHHGQPPLIADLLPGSVDGLMATATVALGDGRRNRWSAWLAFWTGVSASILANVLAAEPSLPARCISAWPAVAFVLVVEVIARGAPGHAADNQESTADRRPAPASEPAPGVGPASTGWETGLGGSAASPGPRPRKPTRGNGDNPTARRRRPVGRTRELAANLRAQNPQISQAEVARRLGISATRLRQIDRAEVHPEHPHSADNSAPLAHEVSAPAAGRPG